MTDIFADLDSIKTLFASPDNTDIITANKMLEALNIDCAAKDEIIEALNTGFPAWHFFMVNCTIKRVRARQH